MVELKYIQKKYIGPLPKIEYGNTQFQEFAFRSRIDTLY